MIEAVADNELLGRVRAGDSRALDVVMRRYKKFVRSKAGAYFLMGADREDLVQEGMIGLFKAARDFNPENRVPFSVFAEICVTRQIMTAIKRAARRKHMPLNSYISMNVPEGQSFDSYSVPAAPTGEAVDPIEVIIKAEHLKHVGRVTKDRLTPLEHNVLVGYVNGRSYSEMAAGLNCPVKSIDNALQRVKRKVAAIK